MKKQRLQQRQQGLSAAAAALTNQHQAAATKLTWRWNTTQLKMGCMIYSFADMPAGV